MASACETGVFGKLPAHGDFIQRNLPAAFVNAWDDWLQHYVSVPRETLLDKWLDIYLTSPMWRFVLSEGAIDTNCWAGVIMPSVDRVGRYFPFTVVKRLDDYVSTFDFLQNNADWFDSVEQVLLQALQEEQPVDPVLEKIISHELPVSVPEKVYKLGETVPVYYMRLDDQPGVNNLSGVMPVLMDELIRSSLSSFSLWSTSGSGLVEPCFFTSQGLPPASFMTSMLNGVWPGLSSDTYMNSDVDNAGGMK